MNYVQEDSNFGVGKKNIIDVESPLNNILEEWRRISGYKDDIELYSFRTIGFATIGISMKVVKPLDITLQQALKKLEQKDARYYLKIEDTSPNKQRMPSDNQ